MHCLSIRIIFISCYTAWATLITLNAQQTNIFDTHKALRHLEFSNQGQIAEKLTFRFQDSRGFIWGSDELYRPMRFDGNRIEIFENNPLDSTTASSGKLWDITCSFFEDSEGKIWITYSTGGYVDCYDPISEKFRQFRPQLLKACGYEYSYNVGAVYEDHLGHIWMAAENNLFRYGKSKDSFQWFKMPNRVTLVFEDNENNLWIHLMYHSLVRINRSSGIIEEQVEYPTDFKPGLDKNWTPQYIDHHHYLKEQNVHLLVVRGRFYEFDAKRRRIKSLHKAPLVDESLIVSFSVKNNHILLTTYSGLLFQYHLENKTFSQSPLFQVSKAGKNSEYSQPYLLLQSSEGIIWANVYQSEKKWIKNIQFFPSKLEITKISVPEELKKVNLAVALGDYCLVLNGEPYFFSHPWLTPINPENSNFKKINLSIPDIQDPWEWTYHFKTAPNGNLWQVASPIYNSPKLIIREYDKNGKILNHFSRVEIKDKEYPYGIVKDVEFDQNGNLWIGSTNGGICQFITEIDSMVNFSIRHKSQNPSSIDLLINSDNSVIAAGRFGVKKLNRQIGSWEDISPRKLANNTSVRKIYEDSDGNIWFCTFKNMYKLDKQVNLFEYGKLEGYLGNGHYIFEDFFQQIWVTSDNKIYLFDKIENRFVTFGTEEGVLGQFFGSPHHINKDSSIIIAGRLNDVHRVRFQKINVESHLPPLYFTDLQLFQEKEKTSIDGILQKALNYTESIQLQYKQNDFTIHYTAPEYTYPDKLAFIVRMQGFNDEWKNLGNKREIRYTNLSPGDYTFQVKLRNHLGIESDSQRKLKITILPPWYRTWWAYTLWVTLILGSIYSFYRFQLNRKLAESEAKRLKELDHAKNILYTNITHEFRTPLTIILGMADQMKTDPKNWFNEGVRLIRRNGKQLLHLVNQMLDLSKLESGQLTLKPILGDIVGFIHYLSESFHSYADSKDIRLHFSSDFKELQMDYDPEKIQHILANLLSNAIKFTPAGGDVYIQLLSGKSEFNFGNKTITVQRGKENSSGAYLLLVVKDNGQGINPAHLPYIFDRFYQGDSSSTRKGEGTGIGLALTKELVKLMDGEIMVESESLKSSDNRGSKFTIALPITQNAEPMNLSQIKTSNVTPTIESNLQSVSGEQGIDVINTNKPIVLIIEDNADVITYLTSFLSKDYQIETATNGQNGIDKALEIIPDLIVSDVMMPEKDGFEVCETLKTDERTSHIPIILLTAKSDPIARLEGLTQGADAYLAKPFNKEELLVRIENLIELRRRLHDYYNRAYETKITNETINPTTEDLFLQRLITIVEENLSNEHFGLPDLCRKANLSRSQLFRKLKALTGKSTTNFIRSIRLAKGKELLETTDQTVSEVAYSVGFRSVPYFSTMFKEAYGITPGEVRR